MNLEIYKTAVRYASKLDYDRRYDLVHDAYLAWFKKTGESLFDCHPGTIMLTVRNIYGGIYTKNNTYMINGEIRNRQFTELKNVRKAVNDYNPEHLLIIDDVKTKLELLLSKKQKEVYDMMIQGYNTVEIAGEIGSYRQLVSGHIRHIRTKFNKLEQTS